MKSLFRLRLPVILLVLVLMSASLPATVAGQPAESSGAPIFMAESNDTAPYRVSKVSTKEDRTAIARTGAGIDEIGADYVIITATPQEVQQIRALGYTVEAVVRPMDFPPADSAYHNYAEMSDEILASRQCPSRHRQPL